jgi:hypothetical protein
MITPRFWFVAVMILMTAASRLIPHPPNFTPLGAIALFGGACFADKRLAFVVPLAVSEMAPTGQRKPEARASRFFD